MMAKFSKIQDLYCPSCGQKTMYEDLEEEGDFYMGTGAYCKSCGSGGYICMCIGLSEKDIKELKEAD
jgi:hypothetical protein